MAKIKGLEGTEKDFEVLEKGIKKLLEDTQEDRFEEMTEIMGERIDEGMSSLKDELERRIDDMKKEKIDIASFLAEIKKNRGRITKMEERLDSFKKDDSTGRKNMEDDIHREFEKVKNGVKQGITENAGTIKNMEAEMANFRERIEEVKLLGDALKGLDVRSVARDIEVLKQKTHWLGENIEKFNIQPLFKRIREIEEEVKVTRDRSPLVIE